MELTSGVSPTWEEPHVTVVLCMHRGSGVACIFPKFHVYATRYLKFKNLFKNFLKYIQSFCCHKCFFVQSSRIDEKSLNRSSLLSEPLFWERWRSIRIRVKSDKRTEKIQILSGSLMSDIGIKERSKNGSKMLALGNSGEEYRRATGTGQH